MNNKIKILLVDDHPMVLIGMEAMLNTIPELMVVAKAKDANEALTFLMENETDMVLTDIHLPETNGIDLCLKISSDYPQIKIIGMSTFHDKSIVGKMIASGATGFLSKSASAEEISEVILGALENQIVVKAGQNTHQPNPAEAQTKIVITRRETEILSLISEGLTTKEIADKIFVSPSTVDSHRKNLMEKFEVLNTAGLITKASKLGMV